MNKASVVILAGGKGSRLGGAKPLQLLQGRPLLEWVIETIRPQCDEVLISANDEPAAYARFNCRVIADATPGYAGPLAGLQAVMLNTSHQLIASVPCDTPFLPPDLIKRLRDCFGTSDAEAVVAVAGGIRQPAIALYDKRVCQKLDAYLKSGARAVHTWQDILRLSFVQFDDAAAFFNINTPGELAQANQILHAGGTGGNSQRVIT